MSVNRGLFRFVDFFLVQKVLGDLFHVVKIGAKSQSIVILHIHELIFGGMDLVITNPISLNNKLVAAIRVLRHDYSLSTKVIGNMLLAFKHLQI
jgi:hypothetical protein